MSLLSALNEVCDIVARDRFETVIGNIDAHQMLEFANQAGEEIGRRVDWSRMFVTDTATGSPYTIQGNFQRLVPGGAIFADDGTFVRPVTNQGEWAIVSVIPSAQPFFFVTGTTILFSQPGTYSVNYVSTEWCEGSDGEPQTEFTADNDTTRFPERLLVKNVVWRWKRQKGLTYDDQLAEFEADLAQELKANRGVMS